MFMILMWKTVDKFGQMWKKTLDFPDSIFCLNSLS